MPYSVRPKQTLLRSFRDGTVLASQTMEIALEGSQRKLPYLLIHRADLQRILKERAEGLGTEIILNTMIESIDVRENEKSSVILRGGERVEADLIIGADGERSFCRNHVLRFSDLPQEPTRLVYRFTVPISELLEHQQLSELADPQNINLWMGPHSHVVSYVVQGFGLLNIALTLRLEADVEKDFGIRRAEISELRKAFKLWDTRFESLLGMTQEAAKWPLLEYDTPKSWIDGSGRFALLGDSAHAMLPCL